MVNTILVCSGLVVSLLHYPSNLQVVTMNASSFASPANVVSLHHDDTVKSFATANACS